jgi:uncharacterized protein (DUF1015 family)
MNSSSSFIAAIGGISVPKLLKQLPRRVEQLSFKSDNPALSAILVTVDDLMEISDAGGIMPPKSTWFEPKLRDGLLSHVI